MDVAVGEQDHELVAAIAGTEIVWADRLREHPGHDLQGAVARLVAVVR